MDALETVTAALSSQYVFEREIGRGGMAVVFLAKDIKHGRRVAVKVLNPELAAVIGPERFLAEIRITANLQHPNLLPLFDSGEVDGMLYYVMPFVDGESLRDKLQREQQLPIDEALHIARVVASALDHAHRHDVIHRDLKPENILLHDGEPVVADFGIALAVSNAGAGRLTQTGLSLGTPHYMSPEQATGERAIDRRADVYALGAVLYEMLIGEPPHTGANSQTVIAKVLTERPHSVRTMRDTVPQHVDAAIARALAKLPADRWSTAHEFAAALAGDPATLATLSSHADTSSSLVARRRTIRTAIPFAAAGLLLGAAGATALRRPRVSADEGSYSFTITLPDSAAVSTGGASAGGVVAISRDGRSIAYVAGPASGGDVTRGIWSRSLDELSPRPVRGIERGSAPRYSPDGSMLAFHRGAGISVMPVVGGSASRVIDDGVSYDWADNESLIYTLGSELWVDSKNRPELWITNVHKPSPRLLVRPDTTRKIFGVAFPNTLPDGAHAVVTIWKGEPGNLARQLAVVSLRDASISELGLAGSSARYSLGQLLFVKEDGALYSAPFSLSTLRIGGSVTQVVPQVVQSLTGGGDFDVSANGTLVYVGGSEARRRLVLVDRAGRTTPITSEVRRFYYPRVSPDGSAIVFETGNSLGFDLWTYDLQSRTFAAVTTDHHSFRPGGWLNGGRDVAFVHAASVSSPWEVHEQGVDGRVPGRVLIPTSSDPNDMAVAAQTIVWRTGSSLHAAPLSAPDQSRLIVPAEAKAGLARLSRDGRYVAYESSATGVDEIYAQPVNEAGSRVQISSGGGTEPVWSPAGDEVFYRSGLYLIAAKITLQPFRVTHRDTLFRDVFVRNSSSVNYDVMPNGKQFVMVQSENPDVYPTVMVNWIGRVARPR
jgi:serine/threonine-protein kinase